MLRIYSINSMNWNRGGVLLEQGLGSSMLKVLEGNTCRDEYMHIYIYTYGSR